MALTPPPRTRRLPYLHRSPTSLPPTYLPKPSPDCRNVISRETQVNNTFVFLCNASSLTRFRFFLFFSSRKRRVVKKNTGLTRALYRPHDGLVGDMQTPPLHKGGLESKRPGFRLEMLQTSRFMASNRRGFREKNLKA